MSIDPEGHVVISPVELYQLALKSPSSLVDRYLIPGTPLCFHARNAYCDFLEHIACRLAIHPQNVILKGSTKIGFSIAPYAGKLWMSYGYKSDLDVAVIDSAFYERLDNEIRHWERENAATIMKVGAARSAMYNRREQRKFYCCRYFDIPNVTTRISMVNCFETSEAELCTGIYRGVDAFVFKDWWSLRSRYEYDIQCILRGVDLDGNTLPAPPSTSFPYQS